MPTVRNGDIPAGEEDEESGQVVADEEKIPGVEHDVMQEIGQEVGDAVLEDGVLGPGVGGREAAGRVGEEGEGGEGDGGGAVGEGDQAAGGLGPGHGAPPAEHGGVPGEVDGEEHGQEHGERGREGAEEAVVGCGGGGVHGGANPAPVDRQVIDELTD